MTEQSKRNLELRISCDASKDGLGAVLQQKSKKIGEPSISRLGS